MLTFEFFQGVGMCFRQVFMLCGYLFHFRNVVLSRDSGSLLQRSHQALLLGDMVLFHLVVFGWGREVSQSTAGR